MNKELLKDAAQSIRITASTHTQYTSVMMEAADLLDSLAAELGDAPDDHPFEAMVGSNLGFKWYVLKGNRDYYQAKCAVLLAEKAAVEFNMDAETGSHIETKKELAAAQQRIAELTRDMEHFEQCIDDNARLNAKISELESLVRDYEEVNADKKRLVRELDVILNGDGAAQQASLCDIVGQAANGGLPCQKDARRCAYIRENGNLFYNCCTYQGTGEQWNKNVDAAIDSNVPGNK